VLDIPNARSSHREATPRGGGVAVTGGTLIGMTVWLALHPDLLLPLMLLGMMALGAVSWLDDRRGGLPVGLRLGVQMLAVGIVLAILPEQLNVTQGLLPVWLERGLLFFGWVWFVNLFNFMDGINGIAGVETVTVGAGAVLVAALQGQGAMTAPGLIVAAAICGFLPWNWGRARVFLGDVGSVPLGYLLGGLLLLLALNGQWAAALILPMYYWMDATVTLLRRLYRRERVWQAHRSHFYQQGAHRLDSHAATAGRIAMLNLLLLGLAMLSTLSPMAGLLALGGALAATALLCRHFAEGAKQVV
jgi:UDP-N-acetylmuramyl pentapeptide phosphotransferase/UDP-N-acetylglucosamine-1-phosphate transferase